MDNKKKFNEYDHLSLTGVVDEMLAFWEQEDIFARSVKNREGATPFVFFEGPPSANGLPGIHHVMARTIKDIFCRYKTLKGFKVGRKAGWDTHGLPVELGVEKELGITKEDIGKKISVEEYNDYCRKVVMRYTDRWNSLTRQMGYWVDMSDPYITYKSKYMESVWWLLSQIYAKGLLYKGYTIQPYSPKAGTGLSSHELNQPGCYRDVSDTTMTAQFKAVKDTLPEGLKKDDAAVYFLAWTTTPWTLPSNTALAVGEKIQYVMARTFNQYTFEPEYVILASDLVQSVFAGKFYAAESEEDFAAYTPESKKIPYAIVGEFDGKTLVGARYEQLMPFYLPYENPEGAFRVIPGDYVTTVDGTGIVHIAPTFGADDARVARDAGVPAMLVKDKNDNLVPLVDLQGRFIDGMGEYSGMYVKNAYYAAGEEPERSLDVQIAIRLKEENKAFSVAKHTHSYPHCWRTDKPVLYYPLDSWFIRVPEVRDRMSELNATIKWKPEATGTGRFGNWLASANDWNLSRSRYWGIPLPIWRTEDGREEMIIGSAAQLKAEIARSIEVGFMESDPYPDFNPGDMSDENYEKIDLHKHIVDNVVLVSPTGRPMRREADLIDVWFDSGSMPYAQWHYPFENKELIDGGEGFPADFIAEGVDQTRGWFYTLHAISTMVKDSVAYKAVMSNGLVLDKNGQKMSKRLGNAVDPFETLGKYGADAVRWYMISNAQPWDNLKFDVEGIEEIRRKFFGTLYNIYSFFALYANLDGFTYSEEDVPYAERPEIDRWILSELNTLVHKVEEALDDYEPTRATRLIQYFTGENLSNWFVRLSRRRYWKSDASSLDKLSAYQTLYTCIETLSRLISPFAPFYADRLFRDLNAVTGKDTSASVHLADYPVYNAAMVDKALEERMELAQKVCSMGLSLRKREMIRVRQPLPKIMIPCLTEDFAGKIKAVENLILSELNVKAVELLSDTSMFVKQIKPDFKKMGPRYGKDMKAVAAYIQAMSQEEIASLEKDGSLAVVVGEKEFTIQVEDVNISTQDVEGSVVLSLDGLTVALDIVIDEKLKGEGIAREVVNRIQNMRKEADFNVSDRIDVTICAEDEIKCAIDTNNDYICSETLTHSLVFADTISDGESVEFDDVKMIINIKKHD
ncbi:MAG: isoleucine--tRNA ligase [Flavobacteriales bacterium]|nr:isoleucine--tRNA ligase [Flavobacteriales bacterium]